MKMNMK